MVLAALMLGETSSWSAREFLGCTLSFGGVAYYSRLKLLEKERSAQDAALRRQQEQLLAVCRHPSELLALCFFIPQTCWPLLPYSCTISLCTCDDTLGSHEPVWQVSSARRLSKASSKWSVKQKERLLQVDNHTSRLGVKCAE